MQCVEVKCEVSHFVDKSATKCAIMQNSALQYGKVWKVQRDITNGYYLIIVINFFCIYKLFCILLGFDCFDISISI